VGSLRHFIGVRVGGEHLARLEALKDASGFTPGEILRRLLLNTEIPSARASQEVQDLLRIQREQSRLGGLLKKAVVPQNVVRGELLAAMLAKATKRTELGPLRALPTAPRAQFEGGNRSSSAPCAQLTPDVVWTDTFA
jgi:hypothetical protein